MTDISTAELANYLELVLDVYFDAMVFPHSEDFKIERHLKLLEVAKNFVDGWKKCDLPRDEMNEGFRNPLVRESILIGAPITMDFVEERHKEWEEICTCNELLKRI